MMNEKAKQKVGWTTRTAPSEVVRALREALETVMGEEIGDGATEGSIREAVERFRLKPTYPEAVNDMAKALQLTAPATTEDRMKHDPLRQERANAVGAELRVIERWEAHEAGE